MQFLQGRVDLFVGFKIGEKFFRGGLIDHAGLFPLLILRVFAVSQYENVALFFAGLQRAAHAVGTDGRPTVGDAVAAFPGKYGVGMIKTVIQAHEGLTVRIKAGKGCVHSEHGVVVAAFAVFGFVVNRAAFHFHFPNAVVALEVGHIVKSIPQAEFHKREQFDFFRSSAFVFQHNPMDFTSVMQRDKGRLRDRQVVFFRSNDRIAHAVAAFIGIQICFDRHPTGIPYGITVFYIEVTATLIVWNVVVAVTCQAQQLCIFIETVPATGVGNQRKEIRAA